MDNISSPLANWIVDRRLLVLGLLFVVSGIAIVGHRNPRLILNVIRPTPEVAAPAAERQNSRPPRSSSRNGRAPVEEFSLSRADAVLVVQSNQFFTPAGASALRAVVKDLEQLQQVRSVLWMDRIPPLNIFGLPEPLFPRSEASPARFTAARDKAMKHPLVGGRMLSSDGKTLLMLITFRDEYLFHDADATTALRETAERSLQAYPGLSMSFQVTGEIPATLAAIASHEANQVRYQLIGYGMTLLMTIILFRGLRAVLIVAAAPATGVFWTMGWIQFFEYNRNPLIDVILPVLVSLVGLTDAVHLMVQIRKLRASGLSERDSARIGLRQVGLACFMTSLTTAIGFGSLTQADSRWVQEFGVCSVVGVILTFVSVVTVIPLACSTWLGRTIHIGLDRSLIDRHLSRMSVLIDYVLQRKNRICVMAVVSTLLLFAVCMTLEPDQRLSDGLPESAEATQAMRHMDEAFGGLEFSQIEVRWDDTIDADSSEILETIIEVDDLVKSEPLIGHPLSIRELIDAQPGSGPPHERMSMMELLPPPLKRAFYNQDSREAKVTFRVQDVGIAAYGPVFQRIEDGLNRIQQQHPRFHFEMKGDAVWRWKNLYQIVVDLAKSLGSASIIILVVLTIVYRSIRLGLISIIPNVFPLALTGAYLAVMGYNLEIVMVLNFTVCLGIAVDDTIHFLTRYREESQQEGPTTDAIRRAFTGVGTALIMTTTVLVVGFSTVMFSDSRDHHIFATMGVLTIAAALFGDLIFLPALLARFGPDAN